MTRHKKSKSASRPLLVALGGGLVVVVGGYLLAAHFCHLWPLAPKKSSLTDSAAHTTSTAPSAQSDFTGDEVKSPSPTPSRDSGNTATDTQTPSQSNTDSSTWIRSKDGSSIVMMGPADNTLFSSGDIIYGTATANMVSYELEDNVSGVILRGQANVVNGKFSVKVSFSTTGTTGRINVFNEATDGTESNNVSAAVRFK